MDSPQHETIRKVRIAADLTQQQAAELVHSKLRAWQRWEAGDSAMHPAIWELFILKCARLNDECAQIAQTPAHSL